MITEYSCLVCEASDLQRIADYERLPRVTSDAKPFPAGGKLCVCAGCGAVQKLPDATWFDEIAAIYDAYEMYELSGGAEQLIFTAAGPVARSNRLVDYVVAEAGLSTSGKLIDIGCGTGAALANFSAALPGWRMFGSELSNRVLPRLQQLPNFEHLYTCPTADIPGGFGLVSMIHSLEHMPSPLAALHQAKKLAGSTGTVFVQVPDVETSPFDLLVADHLSHFSQATLGRLAARVGLGTSVLSNKVLPKEITLIARASSGVAPPTEPAAGVRLAHDTVRWLETVLATATGLAAGGRIGIFGTSIAAMWLFGGLGDAVEFFVDEDPARIGRDCAGRPVHSPQDVPAGATVYVPLIPDMAARVIARHARLSVHFVGPASLGYSP